VSGPDPISIIIPAFNQLAYCRTCVESIVRNTVRPYRLILVDNGSTDGVSEFFDSVEGAEAIHAPENLGFAGGVNLGLKAATGHALLLNSDTIVPPGWLGRLEEALLSRDDMGMVGPMSNYTSGPQLIPDLTLNGPAAIDAYAAKLAVDHEGRRQLTGRLVAFCVLIRDEVVEKVGLFDEGFGKGNFEDDDYCHRTMIAGYKLAIARDSFIFHFGHATFSGMDFTDESWQALMTENKNRFVEKWSIEPEARMSPAGGADALNKEAVAALQEGDAKKALQLLAEAVQLCPHFAEGHNNLGVIFWQEGETDRAYESFARAVRLDPNYEEARDNLRDAAQALGREEEARTLLEKTDKPISEKNHGL
jgi:GT2 family glycosyltransferase